MYHMQYLPLWINESCQYFIDLQGRVLNAPAGVWAMGEGDLMAMTFKLNYG